MFTWMQQSGGENKLTQGEAKLQTNIYSSG